MDAGRLSLCGEESFGTGSDHVREKDGVWAALAWLAVLADSGLSVRDSLLRHWREFGRNYFTRYDYEECAAEPCRRMMRAFEETITAPGFVGSSHGSGERTFVVALADNFSYTDPVDGAVARGQGLRVLFACGARLVLRLSGTGSAGATVRLYAEAYEGAEAGEALQQEAQRALQPLLDLALRLTRLQHFTGRDTPTVIT